MKTEEVAREQVVKRVPLGRRREIDVAATVLRVVGKGAKAPVLDVAAFQSFAG